MGLIIATLVVLTVLFARRAWSRARGVPLPVVTARPSSRGRVRRFLDGLGKARRRPPASPPTAAEVDAWRRAAEEAARRAHGDAARGPGPSPEPDVEVLVVGAGPSGLMAALLLARQGISVRVVDANTGPATESRAFAVQARTVELFRSLGLADALLSRGVISTGIAFHIKGKHVAGLDSDRSRAVDAPYQFILMAPQCEVEELLLHDLVRHGVTVERGVRLESLTQTEDDVLAVLSGAGEEARPLTARYVIGADGAHSTVRRELGLGFEGEQYDQHFLLADCTVEWPFDHTRFRVFVNGERIGLFLPLDGARRSRVMATDLSARDGGDPAPMTLDQLQESLRAAMAVPVTLSDPVWTSRYSVHLRHVEDYRVGRGFLVGDAAHIHSPAGGQGMNTGLHDAANLAWKLAAVLRTGADPALLDSYAAERVPVGKALLRFTDRLYRVAAGQRGWRARLRDAVGPFLLGRMSAAPLPHRRSYRRLSQVGLAYRPSEYVVNELLYSLKGPHAGHRAPDARINDERRMFDLLQGYRLHVVALSRRPLSEAEVTAHTEQLDSLAAFGGGVRTHLVGRVACRRDDRVEPVDSVEVLRHYGLVHDESQALYVVRPDGHVAWRSDELDYDACRRFLARLHGAVAAGEAQRETAVRVA